MLKGLVKISLLAVALIAVAVIPGNAKLVFGYGNAPTFAGSSTNPPVCSKEKPDQVILYEPNHPLLPKATNPQDVRLNWLKVSNANKYTIAFGLSSGNYIYGLPDVGDTNNFTVQSLTPGQKYYFVVRGVNDCMPGLWSREWAATAGGATGGSFTTLNTNSPAVVTPPNIPTVPSSTGVVTPTPGNANVQQPTQEPTQPVVLPPQPTPTPQPGFFQGLWHGFLGIFGIQ